jgi:endonuclease/exonuclease/phosphatase family metal-dependent hydrolase
MSKTKSTSFWFKFLYFINILVCVLMIGAYLATHIAPNYFSYLALLGLAYPYLLWCLTLFSLFWLVFHKKYLLINVIVFLLGWNHFSNYYVFNVNQLNHGNQAFMVMSYNVHIFNLYDKANKDVSRLEMINFIQKQKADVYCFQEFYHQNNSTDFKTKDTLLQILTTKYNHERYTHEMLGEQYFGLSTFTKYPIVGKGEIAFDNDDNNYCIFTDIKKGKDTLRVFNAHIGSIRLQDSDYAFFGDETSGKVYKRAKKEQKIIERLKLAFEKRTEQIKVVMQKVIKSPYEVILCGDLNDTPISYCYRQVSQHLIDAFVESGSGVGSTYIGKIPSNRIDYIFHSSHLMATEFKIHDFNWSDHKPISCYIEKK